MKDIKIVTINDNGNCGNRLQAFALNYYLSSKYDKVKTLCFTTKKDRIKDIIKRFVPVKRNIKTLNKFNKFNKNINIKFIYDIDGLKDDDSIYVVGSDQVWNSTFNSFDKKFLLDFSDKAIKYSYAASFGINDIPSKDKEMFKNELKKFESISVREDAGKEILKNFKIDCDVHIDPTLLVNSEKWESLSVKPNGFNSEKFIFLYFLGNIDEDYLSAIRDFAKKNECDIIDYFNYKETLSPSEFLYLERNAYLICTDSFHSSVFGLIFKKPFVVFERKSKGMVKMNSRLETLLNKFKIDNRKFSGKEISKENYEVNYEDADKILKREIEKSEEYLEKIIKKAREK